MKKTNLLLISLAILLIFITLSASAFTAKRDFYQIKIYHLKDKAQENRLDQFLKDAYLPALHRIGINKVGVFKPIIEAGAAEPAELLLYVFIPFKSEKEFITLESKLSKDKIFTSAAKDYLDAAYDNPPYARIESILLSAFSYQPHFDLPALKSPKSERVYELRSYESATEKIYKNKVQMFNEGGEVTLFKRLNFNAVFYGEVISGAKMPNLMYMTTFENKTDRDAHWKTFVDDPEWKKLSAMPEYQHNVSHIDITFLRPVDYSDI